MVASPGCGARPAGRASAETGRPLPTEPSPHSNFVAVVDRHPAKPGHVGAHQQPVLCSVRPGGNLGGGGTLGSHPAVPARSVHHARPDNVDVMASD